jgi:hypothetical protein
MKQGFFVALINFVKREFQLPRQASSVIYDVFLVFYQAA